MANKIIYPEVSFTEEWKEGRRYERNKIIKIVEELNTKWGPFNPAIMELEETLLSGDKQ